MSYKSLSKNLIKKIEKDAIIPRIFDYSCSNDSAIRKNLMKNDVGTLWIPTFARDVEKILHLPLYNRYSDKTQVFSFYFNDDITRRALHVQLVSRIARNIGKILRLNLDLIEAIALGHDIGHTPFGHTGEEFLDEIYHRETGRYFNHNVQSARVFYKIFARNLSLQTLDGILCHNGAFLSKYENRSFLKTFEEFDEVVEECNIKGRDKIETLVSSTLEGCIVRISDMIAYLGKDRQDAIKAHIININRELSELEILDNNSEMINNISVNIIENSYGKDYISMDPEILESLISYKKENNKLIYKNSQIKEKYNNSVKPMFEEVYYRLLDDVKLKKYNSLIFDHHIDFINKNRKKYIDKDYFSEEANQIVVDYISSMTDDYFVELYKHLFPNGKYNVEYISYFGK
ncbi:MAG: HD domain-containing protein [Fusobacteriaceae bacterium]|jgi:dGTPase|nr:HD domain-containing protein [Fusobacteriaceae bacterium]